ncbi:hypothetical protein EV363DRAFT_1366591 [Boletus edulis]|nr:hypothetical protein EV363DRAFT_1366591 [Boletus edulis]
MQPAPNRLGLGLRPPLPSYGQGPSISALAQQQQMMHQPFMSPQKQATLFVGSISGEITDTFLNQMLSLPALEDGCANKKLLVHKSGRKDETILDAHSTQKMKTVTDEAMTQQAKAKINGVVEEINRTSRKQRTMKAFSTRRNTSYPLTSTTLRKLIFRTQCGLVISEITRFRERAATREREKVREVRKSIPNLLATTPSGPKRDGPSQSTPGKGQQAPGKGPQSYSKPLGFVKAEDTGTATRALDERSKGPKTDEEMERDRKDATGEMRGERRYEPRERARIAALERSIARQNAIKEAEERDRVEMQARLDVWDDDESDELFYVDRARWRQSRARRVAAEEAADAESRAYEEREAENLRIESEKFLARQMEDMQALAEEQRKAGMLLDDGAPVKLSMSIAPGPVKAEAAPKDVKTAVFGQEEEEEEDIKKRKVPLVKLDFSAAEGEKAKERLQTIKESVPHDKETLFKAKVRWDGLNDSMVDRKFEPLVKRLMVKYLGELEDDDLIMFVLEHLKDHKGPLKLVDGLEPVLEEEAQEFAISVWRQVIFESMAYGEGLLTERMMVD